MSKSSLLAGSVGGLIGAVLGGGLMLVLRPASKAAPPPKTGEMREAFADALTPLLDEIIHGKTITLVFSRGRLVHVYD